MVVALQFFLLLSAWLSGVVAQFGNAQVQWENANPTVTTPTAHANADQASLQQLSAEDLVGVLSGLNVECDSCNTRGHYISRIRSACLSMGPKALKAQCVISQTPVLLLVPRRRARCPCGRLAARGVACDGCTMREHYLDRVLDTVHVPRRK
jgi:hypothetical protein